MGSIGPQENMLSQREPLAIIGMAVKLPGDATGVEDMWKMLLQGRCAASSFPEDRLNADAYYHPDPDHGGTFAVKGGHFLKQDPACFDSAFFNVTKEELMAMDPQQRLVMENVYHCLENSGIPMNDFISSKCSVFASGWNHEHQSLLNMDPEWSFKYKPTGASSSIISNRVSWFFDLHGPSITVDTACSSSMVALHLAAQSLHSHESEMAIVTGVSLLEVPSETIGMSHHGLLSSEGRCYSFDHRGDGYSRGEGVGTIFMKPLGKALRDGDTIRALVRGTGVNQDGKTQGITLPSSDAQADLIREVYRKAGLGVEDTVVVEAHGTGTSAGDPIEARALAEVFRPCHSNKIPLHVCASKSNFGHLEGGSGVVGLVKAVLMLEKAIIPPNVNFETLNPQIPAEKWNMKFPLENEPWPTDGLRRVSVNSFGFGGTNAHCILDDAYHYLENHNLRASHKTATNVPTKDEILHLLTTVSQTQPVGEFHCTSQGGVESQKVSNSQRPNFIIPISAFDSGGVSRNATALGEYLGTRRGDAADGLLRDLSLTIAKRRTQFPWKSFVLGSSLSELETKLLANDFGIPPLKSQHVPQIGFVFTGQGAQYHAMGQALMAYRVFRESIEQASEFMTRLWSPWSLVEELFESDNPSSVTRPDIAHPSCVALQVALVDLIVSWGILPARVIGHSSGEIPAAYASGKLSREAAWTAGYYRGYVSNQIQRAGAMIAIGLGPNELFPYIEKLRTEHPGELRIACYNSPRNSTVSGDENLVGMLKSMLDKEDVFNRKLNVKNAYHSSHMEDVASEYIRLMGNLPEGHMVPYDIPMFSTVTGKRVEEERLDAKYWADNMVSPVRFQEGLTEMCLYLQSHRTISAIQNPDSKGRNIMVDQLIEIGPHCALKSAISDILALEGIKDLTNYLPTLNRNDTSSNGMLHTVGTLFAVGAKLDIHEVNKSSGACQGKGSMLTDLPYYTFNHAEKIIYESRLGRNLRLRRKPRQDLLGAPVMDWNPESPRWRHFLRLRENPWIRDHGVTGSFIYPGVGHLIMAIEGARQMATPDQGMELSGFRLKQVAIKRALVVPDDQFGVETSLAMTAVGETAFTNSSTWKKFQISSYNPVGEEWIEHCTGYIAAEYRKTDVGGSSEGSLSLKEWGEALSSSRQNCQAPIDIDQCYDDFAAKGLKFGDLFQNLSNVHLSGRKLGEAFGTVNVPDVASHMPYQHIYPHLIHPTSMDSMLHLFLACILDYNGRDSIDIPYVPTFIRDMWVSAGISSDVGHPYYAHGTVSRTAYEKFECDLKVWDGKDDSGRIHMNGIRLAPLESGNERSDRLSRQICHQIEWGPDIDLLGASNLKSIITPSPRSLESERNWMKNFQLASALMIHDALVELERSDFSSDQLDNYLTRYHAWLHHFRGEVDVDKVTQFTSDEFREFSHDEVKKSELYHDVANHNAAGALAVRMGSNIPLVLRKEADPMQLMFAQDDILTRVYDEMIDEGDLPSHLRTYLSILKHNRAGLKILEIGAGTGSSTEPILQELCPIEDEAISSNKFAAISEYTFTDVSAGFFEKAKERFRKWNPILNFQTFDIEKDPVVQGFELHQYDIVIAGNVVHATENVRKTLANLRRLLSTGGKILMHEIVRKDLLWIPIAFGQLPGWWLSVEENRKLGPTMLTSEWNNALKDSGFSGVDIEFPSSPHPDMVLQSILVSTAAEEQRNSQKSVGLLMPPSLQDSDRLIFDLHQYLEGHGFKSSLVALGESPSPDTVYISLLELYQPLVANIEEHDYHDLRGFLSVCKSLLWVTGDPTKQPGMNAITGLLRTMRLEREADNVNFINLAIADEICSERMLMDSISALFSCQFNYSLECNINSEYLLRDGVFHTNRLVDASGPDNFLAARISNPEPVLTPFGKSHRPIKLSISVPGMLQSLEWITDDGNSETLSDTMVEVEIKSIGMNFRDVMIAMGEYAACDFGGEAAGIVNQVGSKVTRFKPGDQVVYLGGLGSGCFQTYGRVDESFAVHLPENLDFSLAAGLPCVWVTVLYALQTIAHLAKGETILIHSAAGGVGQAAIQYANITGATIYATVSTPEKRQVLISEYGIPEDHIFSSRDLNFADDIMRATHGRGVDVILNSLSGEALKRSWECIAPLGRLVELGRKDAQDFGHMELAPLLRNVTLASVQLPTVMSHQPTLIAKLLQDTMSLFSEGSIHSAKPTTVLKYSEIEKGLRMLQGGTGIGKIVLSHDPDDRIPIVPALSPPCQFDPNGSYVLAGGLGGIGRSIARWMAAHGARHLIFLSRSSHSRNEAVQNLISDLQEFYCVATILVCDVSDKESVQDAFVSRLTSFPQIKGCIQCAMVLKDSMFENMTYHDWQVAVKPKIQGSWNLHEALPLELDFFTMLSSASGVMGAKSLANYAAGGTFQDALAQYRVFRGLPATTLDLGAVLSIGFVAENLEYSQRTTAGMEPLRESEIHSLLEYVINTQARGTLGRHATEYQLTAGLSSEAMYLDRGVPAPAFLDFPLFTHLRLSGTNYSDETQEGQVMDVRKSIQLCKTQEDAVSEIAEGIRNKLSSLLATPVDNIELSKSISSNGVDSLVATEFRTWLVKELCADIPLLDITGNASVLNLSEKIARVTTLVDFSKSEK